MFDYGHGIIGFILSLITLIHALVACITSFIVICIAIHHQYTNRLKREEKITLLLSLNIYILIFMYIAPLLIFNFQTIIGDIYGYTYDSSWCTFNGYFIISLCCALYHTFVVQALYRLNRIVYSKYRLLRLYSFYMIIMPIQLITAFALLSPVLIWENVIYLPNDHFCCVSFKITRGILWSVFACYGFPLIYLFLIYNRITIFLRHQTNLVTFAIKQRQQRNLAAFQHILINVGLLLITGLPAMVLLAILFITGVEHPLLYRISWIGAEVSMAFLSVGMVFTTPQLKNIVIKRWRPITRSTILIQNSIQVDHIAEVY